MAALERHLPPPTPAGADPIPSSSPVFATPLHPIRYNNTTTSTTVPTFNAPAPRHATTILPILLPPPTLRPIAFRTFTKKHNLTLTSTALAALATFIGRNCGSGWREEGLAELVLEEVAKSWKKSSSDIIVDGASEQLTSILHTLESCMSGGRIVQGKSTLSRQTSFALDASTPVDNRPSLEARDSFGMSNLEVDDDDDEAPTDLRSWVKVVSAFEQPRMLYNPERKHFEKATTSPSFFPSPAQKTELFRQRYYLMQQRLLRNEHFQAPSAARQNARIGLQSFSVTQIANLLGRSGTGHLLLGLLVITPAGQLAINDLSGSIALDLQQATPIDQQDSWLTPGMIVLVDGVYEEEYSTSSGLGNQGGIGGTISGRFVGFQVGAPKCEPRAVTLGTMDDALHSSTGFGWIDFLGQGSERATGQRMRRMERRLLAQHPDRNCNKIVMIGEVNLDSPRTLEALKAIFNTYATDSALDVPSAFVLMGNFVRSAAMAGGASGGSIEYKEYFDGLAALLSDFSLLLSSSTFIFVPGDNDPWASAFSAGAATAIPRNEVPDLFTSRIRRVFANANTTSAARPANKTPGAAVWTTNPSRLALFGPAHEIVFMRDDVSTRLRRNAIRLQQNTTTAAPTNPDAMDTTPPDAAPEPLQLDVELTQPETVPPQQQQQQQQQQQPTQQHLQTARRLTKTLLDQAHLSPFPLTTRPVHWAYACSALALYPLPSTLVLCDAEVAAFTCTYQGCHVINVGAMLEATASSGVSAPAGRSAGGKGKVGRVGWVEYDLVGRKGVLREAWA